MGIANQKDDGILIMDENDRILSLDKSAWVIPTTDYPHSEAHGGRAFLAVYSALKDNTESMEVRFQAPDSLRLPHLEIAIDVALAATIEFWKDTTKTDVANNRVGSLNRRFGSVNTAGMIVCHTPGGSQAGNAHLLKYAGAAASGGRVAVGGGAHSRGEFILNPNSAHLIKVTSRADGNALTVEFDWYEHTDKEQIA